MKLSSIISNIKNISKKNRNNTVQGFTLIELLVVIAVIGVLAMLIVPNLMGVRQRARDSQAKANLQSFKKALRLYYNDNQSYPPSSGTGSIPLPGVLFGDGGSTIYIQETPAYTSYYIDSTGDRFVIFVNLENASDQDIVDSQERCGYVSSSVVSGSSIDDTGAPNPTNVTYVVCED